LSPAPVAPLPDAPNKPSRYLRLYGETMSSDLAANPPSERVERPPARRALSFVPVVVFAAIAVMFAWGLTHDPREIPSNLIGKPVPQFNLPPVQGRTLGLASGNLCGEVSLVNVFASWCAECRLEHPLILQLKAQGVVTIHGLNYKDKPDEAARWLNTLGDPYTRTGADISGRVGID
jgi:cytochrome c biogenesis protein CcmG/thiol:disulfide interchange protein DsbE